MHSGYHSSGMVISGTCTTEYETGSDDSLGVEGDDEVEGSTGVGVILLFLVTGPSEVTVTCCSSLSVTTKYGYHYWRWGWGHTSESFWCSYEGWCWYNFPLVVEKRMASQMPTL